MSRRRGPRTEPDPRSQARERSLSLLYEAETKGISGSAVLASLIVPADDLVVEIVTGVGGDLEGIDEVISAHAQGWSIERMPAIDRTILRIAVFELMHRLDVPAAVILDEAVGLAKRFSTEDSGRYVNGVLAASARSIRP